jgi:hypothetical protein
MESLCLDRRDDSFSKARLGYQDPRRAPIGAQIEAGSVQSGDLGELDHVLR